MELLTATRLVNLCDNYPRIFQGLLPELVKRLIICSQKSIKSIRIPSFDDIWSPGFDGVIECAESSFYVNSGDSVWEFGTSVNYINKINDDYDKRTKDPRGFDIKNTTIYLVTPRIWSGHKSIEDWQNEKTDWKKVYIYDGVKLASWINTEPAVLAWLYEQLFQKEELSFQTVSSAWDSFIRKTNPPFTSVMFLDRREEEEKALYSCILEPIVRIKADTRIESYGFALAALKENADYRETCIVVNNPQTLHLLSSQVNNKVFLLNYHCTEDVDPRENTVIICFNKEAISIHEHIKLNPLTKSHYVRAFKSMGLDEVKINELYAFTHGNMRALIRRIPGYSNEEIPDWAEMGNIHLLAPVMLLHSFHSVKDRHLVELLAGVSYEEVENKYNELLMLEDSPIKKVGDYYSIIDFESTFAILNIHPSDTAFQRLTSTILSILDSINKLGTCNGHWSGHHSVVAILRNLLLNYVYFSELETNDASIAHAINKVLEYAYLENTSHAVINNLSIMAEAAPNLLIDFIQEGLQQGSKPLLSLFADDCVSNDYSRLLSALDELGKHDETAIRACYILFDLFLIEKEYRIANTPEDSLLKAMCLWHNFGTITLAQKTALFKKFIISENKKGSELFAKTLKQTSVGYGVRIGAKEINGEPITKSEYYDAVQEIGEVAFSVAFANNDAEIIIELLGSYFKFSPGFLLAKACDFSPDSFSGSDLINLNCCVRNRAFQARKYHIENFETYQNVFTQWIDKTTPDDSVFSLAYLFHDYYHCPLLECLDKEDPIEEEQFVEKHRIEVLKKLIEQNGIERVCYLARCIDGDYRWGYIFAAALSSKNVIPFTKELLLAKKWNPLCSMINSLDKATANMVFQTIPENVRLQLLPGIYRKDSYEWLTTHEREEAFWSKKTLRQYDEKAFQTLLERYPEGLLLYCFELSKSASENSINTISEVLVAVSKRLENENEYNRKRPWIGLIIENVEKTHYSEKWAELCYRLFKNRIIQKPPKSVQRYLFENPEKLLNIVLNDSEAEFLLRWSYILPPEAYFDYACFKQFFLALIANMNPTAILLAGAILGKTKSCADGSFPHEFTSCLLEELKMKELDDAVFLGKINAIEARTINDGEDQMTICSDYLKRAKEIEIDYPHTANLLRKLGNYHLYEGKKDYTRSELEYY